MLPEPVPCTAWTPARNHLRGTFPCESEDMTPHHMAFAYEYIPVDLLAERFCNWLCKKREQKHTNKE
jgi:hypothetical protein